MILRFDIGCKKNRLYTYIVLYLHDTPDRIDQ